MNLKTKYQFISFEVIEEKSKTKVWQCINNKSMGELGIIKWYPTWRQYCYFPTVQAIYSMGCLNDIQDFIKQLGEIKK